MTNNLSKSWPTFAPINLSFDQTKLKEEILKSGILEKGSIATTHSVDGKNYWDNGINFQDERFKKLKDVPLWANEEKTSIIQKDINTFYQVNLTTYKTSNNVDTWEGKHQDRSRIPLWIKNDYAWSFRDDVYLPYLAEIIDQLNLEYFSMIRIVYQNPPSIGLIHKDSGPNTNKDYYDNGGVSITLNICSGGANLYFVDKELNERTVDENEINVWHFDDSALHCTTEVSDHRIQIRIYGKHRDYRSLFDAKNIII